MSIAIMACRKVLGKCAASGCFKSYNNSEKAFEIYGDKKEELASFFYCSGCVDTLVQGENWTHKVKQLRKNGVETIHIAHCIESKCYDIKRQEKLLEKEGFKIILGTH